MAEPHPLDPLEDAAAHRVLGELRNTRAELDAILARDRGLTEFGRAAIERRRVAVENAVDRLTRGLVGGTTAAVQAGASAAAREVSDLGVPVSVDPGVLQFAQETAAAEVVDVTDGVRRSLRRATVRALAGGLDANEFELEIRKAFGVETEARIERVARTELGRAYGQQGAAANRELLADGSDMIQRWVTFLGDGRARPTHVAVNGQERELDQAFNVGEGADFSTPPGGAGFECNAPQDPALPAEESINCRCRRMLVPRSEAIQPYIAKVRGDASKAAGAEEAAAKPDDVAKAATAPASTTPASAAPPGLAGRRETIPDPLNLAPVATQNPVPMKIADITSGGDVTIPPRPIHELGLEGLLESERGRAPGASEIAPPHP